MLESASNQVVIVSNGITGEHMATINLSSLTTIKQVNVYISEALGSNRFRQRTVIESTETLLDQNLLIGSFPQPLRLSVTKIAYNDDTVRAHQYDDPEGCGAVWYQTLPNEEDSLQETGAQ